MEITAGTIDNHYFTLSLIDSMGDDLSIVNAARQSFGRRSDEMGKRDKGLINFLMRERHGTPFEAVTFTSPREVPILGARQLMRHRMASYNELSRRSPEIVEGFYQPEPGDMRVRSGKAGSYVYTEPSHPLFADEASEAILESCRASFGVYTGLLDQGLAPELARVVLPLGTWTTITMTANLRSMFNLFSLRSDSHAQLEIRELSVGMEELVARVVPQAFYAFEENGRYAP